MLRSFTARANLVQYTHVHLVNHADDVHIVSGGTVASDETTFFGVETLARIVSEENPRKDISLVNICTFVTSVIIGYSDTKGAMTS